MTPDPGSDSESESAESWELESRSQLEQTNSAPFLDSFVRAGSENYLIFPFIASPWW